MKRPEPPRGERVDHRTLAERLQLRHHTVVELGDRLAAKGMVARRRPPSDRRRVVVEVRPAGHAVLNRLALYSIEELRTEGPALVTTLTRLIGGTKAGRRVRPRRSGLHVAVR
jgi:DNA-binding MarR family transcriptional regulator